MNEIDIVDRLRTDNEGCGDRMEEAACEIERLRHELAQCTEAFQTAKAGQPIGPVIGAQTIINQQREIERMRRLVVTFAGVVEAHAFAMPAPNEYTPIFVQLANTARSALKSKPNLPANPDESPATGGDATS